MDTTAKKVPLRQRRKMVRSFRKHARLNLAKLGELSGLSQPMLSRFESGKRNLSDAAWERLLNAIETFLVNQNEQLNSEIKKAKQAAAKAGASVPITKQLDHIGEL